MCDGNYSADIVTQLDITCEARKKRMSRGIFETCWRIPVSQGYKYQPKERERERERKREREKCRYENVLKRQLSCLLRLLVTERDFIH
jgi:hypothetical protein